MRHASAEFWGVFDDEKQLYIDLVNRNSSIVRLFRTEQECKIYYDLMADLLGWEGYTMGLVGPKSMREAKSRLMLYHDATPGGVYTINSCAIVDGEWPETIELLWDPRELTH